MNSQHLNQNLLQEHERQQRTAALTGIAEEMRNKRASQRSIHTALTDYNEYLLIASRPFFCKK